MLPILPHVHGMAERLEGETCFRKAMRNEIVGRTPAAMHFKNLPIATKRQKILKQNYCE